MTDGEKSTSKEKQVGEKSWELLCWRNVCISAAVINVVSYVSFWKVADHVFICF